MRVKCLSKNLKLQSITFISNKKPVEYCFHFVFSTLPPNILPRTNETEVEKMLLKNFLLSFVTDAGQFRINALCCVALNESSAANLLVNGHVN